MADTPITRAPTRRSLSTGITVSFVEAGDPRSDEVLVLLPGLSDSWRSYELVLPHLPRSIRTFAVSQRGHGESDKPSTGYSVREFANDVGALLDALGLRRVFLAGHSSASIVARRFALDHPGRVAGLVLEGSFVTLRGRVPAPVATQFRSMSDPISRDFVRAFVAGTFARPPPPLFVETMVDEAMKVPARVWSGVFDSLLDYEDSSELATLGAPALVVWGDQDGLIDRSATDALARSIRSSRLVVHGGIGHTPHWEAPERYASDVAAFMHATGDA